MSPRRVPRWVWARVATPKWLTVITSLGYLLAAGAGFSAVVHQPNSIEGAIGGLAMYCISGLLLLAGVIGAPTSLFGEWKIERHAALLALLGVALYLVVVLVLHVQGTGNRLLQAGVISLAGLGLLTRAVWTWKRPLAPREETVLGPDRS